MCALLAGGPGTETGLWDEPGGMRRAQAPGSAGRGSHDLCSSGSDPWLPAGWGKKEGH